MHNVLRKSSDWLEKMRCRHATDEVVYQSANFGSMKVRATSGLSRYEVNGADGMLTNVVINDFLISVADFTPKNQPPRVPATGDQIIINELVYEVTAPGGSEPEWRYSDNFQKTYRIHTKYVGMPQDQVPDSR